MRQGYFFIHTLTACCICATIAANKFITKGISMEAGKFLSPGEEQHLFYLIRTHSDVVARQRFVLAYLPLVRSVVAKNRVRLSIESADDFNDYVQEGVFGLMHALEKYQPEKGAYATYAWRWIVHYLHIYKRKRAEHFALEPIQTPQSRVLVWKAYGKWRRTVGRAPTLLELSESTGLSPHKVSRELMLPHHRFIALEARGDGDLSFGDRVSDTARLSPEACVIAQEMMVLSRQYIQALIDRVQRRENERDCDIFLRRHALEPYDTSESLLEIAALHNVSSERIRQITDKIWGKLSKGSEKFSLAGLTAAQEALELLPETIDA